MHTEGLGFSGAVVHTLLEPYLDKGHILYTDNYYTSPHLTTFLHEHNTGACGTVRQHRKHMPTFGPVSKGETELQTCETMLAQLWVDKRPVSMLTTLHTGAMTDSGKTDRRTNAKIYKPDCINDYTVNMRLIDKTDMQIGSVECVRRPVNGLSSCFTISLTWSS